MKNKTNHEKYMRIALKEAYQAAKCNEVPVGAVIVYEDSVIACAHNTNHRDQNALVHAEIKVIDQACKLLGTKDLSKTTLYITLEPCMMCTGAIIQARISNVYFGAFDLESGNILSNNFYENHVNINWHGGILKEDCSRVLKDFFKEKREEV